MRAVTLVLPDEMANVSIARLQGVFFLHPDLTTRGLTGQMIPIPYPIYIEKKILDLEQELLSLLQSYELRGKQPFISDFSRLLRHAIEKGRGPILYSKKKPEPHGDTRNTPKKVSNTVSDEDIMENNYMFVMLWNLSVISHCIFPQCFF